MSNPNPHPLPPGKGRTPGVPNKATANAREAIAAFVEGNIERLNGWLDEIAAKEPKQAFDCFMSVIEYNIPKLARSEHTGKDGAALFPQKVEIVLVAAKPKDSDT